MWLWKKYWVKTNTADLAKSNAYVFTDLNIRHWDKWNTGKCSHVFVADIENGRITNETDIMPNEPYDVPQKPSGGLEDMIFSPDGKSILYVCKKKTGKAICPKHQYRHLSIRYSHLLKPLTLPKE
jgi:Tol biopolymer transport system component